MYMYMAQRNTSMYIYTQMFLYNVHSAHGEMVHVIGNSKGVWSNVAVQTKEPNKRVM